MSVYQNTDEVEIREQRLNAVLSYHGTLEDMLEKSSCSGISGACGSYEQCANCSQASAATVTIWVKDAVVISHAPVGCSLESIDYAESPAGDLRDQERQVWHLVTNIGEKDTIYGASEKLNTAIDEAVRRFDPRAVFILSSCVAGIIGEDLESTAYEKEDEYGIPIVPIYCEGFKSRVWSSGFDAGYHGVLRKLVHTPEKKQNDLINVFNFIGSDRLEGLLAKVGLRTNYVTPFATVEDLQAMAEAACSVQFCETLSSYITAALEESYGVTKIKNPPPYGIKWTDDWLREIGRCTGKEKEIEKLIESEHERIAPELSRLREKLKGKKAYIVTGDTFAFQLANAAADLGMEIVGISPLHHDQKTDGDGVITSDEKLHRDRPQIQNVNVCAKQPYQTVRLIKEADPDFLLFRHTGIAGVGYKLGIAVLPEGNKDDSIAYEGVLKLGRRALVALKTRKLRENIAGHAKLPYTDWWMNGEESPDYFSEKEVDV